MGSGEKYTLCVGGFNANLTEHAFFAVYEMETDTWTRQTAHETTLGIRVGMTITTNASGDKAYIVGGTDGTTPVLDVSGTNRSFFDQRSSYKWMCQPWF